LLASLAQQTTPHQTIIVDNASTDDSARAAHSAYPQHSYLPLRRNTGFAHAANLIAEKATTDIIVFVNPDMTLAPDFVEKIVAPFDGTARLGAVAGTLVFDSAPSIIASAGIEIHRNGVAIDRLLGQPNSAQILEPIFGASGGAAAYRRTAFLDVGGFPDHFFMYLEDVDLALRLQLRGWDAVWQPHAVARHAYSASAVEGSPFKRKLIARNRIWTLARCFPASLLPASAPSMALYDLMALSYGIIRDRPAAIGRVEAFARLLPRWCERREIAPDEGEVQRIAAWLKPAISPFTLRKLRQITARFASSG
jgi:GT2 family glycosyltransferase